MLLTKFKNRILRLLVTSLIILLIIDIQDGSFDTPVVVLHYSHFLFGYINNLKMSNTIFDVLILKQILSILNLYLLNLEIIVLLDLITQIINCWVLYFHHQTNNYLTLLPTLPKLTFSKSQSTNLRAFISIP